MLTMMQKVVCNNNLGGGSLLMGCMTLGRTPAGNDLLVWERI